MKTPFSSPSLIIRRLALVTLVGVASSALLKAADTPSKPKVTEAQHPRLVSLVLLLSETRTLDAGAAAKAVSVALGREVPESAVSSTPPSFMVKTPVGRFVINSVAEPYFDDSIKLAAELKDKALASAVSTHRAWLSVDWAEQDKKADLRLIYQHIGKITAQFVTKDTLALYSPDTDQFHINDPSLLDHLKSADPLQDLVPAGIIAAESNVTINEDDPLLMKAQAEARARWPEFVKAFKERTKDQYFAVKGRVLEDSNGEYLWLQVTEIDDHLVHGVLDNDPELLKKIVRGADLHIAIADVDDWLYTTGSGKGEPVGGFTLRLFDQLAQAALKK